jgi:hypothetical protein
MIAFVHAADNASVVRHPNPKRAQAVALYAGVVQWRPRSGGHGAVCPKRKPIANCSIQPGKPTARAEARPPCPGGVTARSAVSAAFPEKWL